jgi:hypothetical protein
MLRKSLVAFLIFTAAGLADATVGSVISSFRVPGEYASSVDAIYRDSSHVYCMVWHWVEPFNAYTELQRFTASGSRVSRTKVEPYYTYNDADRCHLGAGYFAVLDGSFLKYVVKETGAVVGSCQVFGPGTSSPVNLAWDGTHYYVSSGSTRGDFRRYTPSGAYAGTWSSTQWPPGLTMCLATTFAHRTKKVAGRFLVAAAYYRDEPCCIINMWGGKVTATWSNPAMTYTCACYGDSSKPATYGAALWLGGRRRDESLWVYEVDVEARDAAAVVPSSVGRVKAIYR